MATFKKFPVKVNQLIPICHCGGEYKVTGKMEGIEGEIWHEHMCDKCCEREKFPAIYPIVLYERVKNEETISGNPNEETSQTVQDLIDTIKKLGGFE
jgi:hypothetical protein